ncbi:hypothetical protein [Gloeothece verrucosa]|uniref:O-antigen polymerase n=1 Tax=Gloeothece verrucosa (strain PCC 7822) TaxID=497965 RepID=E0UAN3_GLOV7|nr:hypothetical protein [Gloeothece verrucosa]ADN13885.1 conserved hypothetical protein [Gloeothece verrucosa PCC 7822]
MTPQAQLVMILWLPITFYLFTRFSPRTAVIMSFIGGLLFLPQSAGFKLPLIPDYQGMVATCYGIILGVIIYDIKTLARFQFQWIDLPMLVWCICPMFSSLSNDLGAYDGFNATLTQTTEWGLPYLLGRLYLNNLAGLKELAMNIIKGGLLYVPLCWFEFRFSPQLHRIVYGYHPHQFGQSVRLGGYRPVVFMRHGLMVALWMMLVTLVIFWLWKAKAIQKIWRIPINWLVGIMLLTFILLRSSGAYIYFLYALIILFAAKWLRTNLPLLLLMAGICYYLFINISGQFNGDELVSWAANFNQDRASSLEFRFKNEELLIAKARQRMIFGWGGWGRNRVYTENWQGELEDTSVTDSLWIIIFGTQGIVGIASFTTMMLLPVLRFCIWGYPCRTWFNPKIAPAAALAVGLPLFVVDCLLNAMPLPVFPLICGGLSGLSFKPITVRRPQLSNLKATQRFLKGQSRRAKFPN